MSTFFKALERAEQERALQRPPTPSAPSSAPGPTAAETVPARAPQSFFKPPRAGASGHQGHAHELEEHLVSLLAPTSFEAEQYRALRHVIEQLRRSTELSVIAVSSPDAADGKTTTAINLAGALAQAPDARVLLVDADLRGASLAAHLGLDDPAPGLVDVIMDANLTLEGVAQAHRHLNLSVLTAGRRPAAPYEVLKSPRVGELLAAARTRYDYVVVDTPPLVSVPDGRIIGKWVDGFLMVVAAHRTPRKLLEEALSLLEPTQIVGLVFNGDDRHLSRNSSPSRRVTEMSGGGLRRRAFTSRTRRRQTASGD